MDHGHGLVDRFRFVFPKCLRPSPEESDAAQEIVSNLTVGGFAEILVEIHDAHQNNDINYKLCQSARMKATKCVLRN